MSDIVVINSFTVVPNYSPLRPGGFDFYWSVTANFGATFMPQQAPTESGPWIDVLDTATSDSSTVLGGPLRLSFQFQDFFRLNVLNGTTIVATSAVASPGMIMTRHDWLIYREILRRERLGLVKYQGQQGCILRRKIYGEPCTVCLDESLGGVAKSNCSTCYGTGFTGGYETPFPSYIDYQDGQPTAGNATQDPLGIAEVETPPCLMLAYPIPTYKDVWVDKATNIRFEVKKIETTFFRSKPTRHIVTLSRIPPSDIIYTLTT